MIVLDASVVVDLLLDSLDKGPTDRIWAAAPDLAAPALVDVEVGQVLRRFVLSGQLTEDRARGALLDLVDLPLLRYGQDALVQRAFDLYPNATFYDAMYIALSEGLEATLLTRDAALMALPGTRVVVEVV